MEGAENERVSIYIDGGNFFHLVLKKLGIPESSFNFGEFTSYLVGERSLVSRTFYTGTVREYEGDRHSREAMSRQTSFLTGISKQGIAVATSKLRRRQETIKIDSRVTDYQRLRSLGVNEISYFRDREKGIDVRIATDLLMDAVEDKYDTAILISSDGDFVPAIKRVKEIAKKVEYVGFSLIDSKRPEDAKCNTKPLSSLINNSTIQRILVQPDLEPFIIPELEL